MESYMTRTQKVLVRCRTKVFSWGFKQTIVKAKLLIGFAVFVVMLILVEISYSSLDNNRLGLVSFNQRFGYGVGSMDKPFQDWPCLDRLATQYRRVEDIFCIILPKFEPSLKNPCFYDYDSNTTSLRCLPYFFIIGMDKSGSTDLHSRLAEHPMLMGNKGDLGKETCFWSWFRYGMFNKRSGLPKLYLDDYITMFSDTADILTDTNLSQIITGDATPMDLWDFRSWPDIPQNRNKTEPQVLTPHLLRHIYHGYFPKFIVQFREPIERLYSDYIFLEYGTNTTEFHEDTMRAIEMFNSCVGNTTKRLCYFSKQLYHDLPVRIHLGCYSVFLKEWLNVFPQEHFLILRTDEYMNDMQATLNKVFHFLELPQLPDFKMEQILGKSRRHVTKKKEGIVLPETVAALKLFYEGCNQEMAELVNDKRFLWLDHYT